MTSRHRKVQLIGAGVLVATALCAPLSTGCREEPPAPSPPIRGPVPGSHPAIISAWQPIFVGVEMCEVSAVSPRPLQIRALRIDLHEESVELFVTPSNGEAPKDCAARTTSQFLTEFKCQAAINGSAFIPMAGQAGDPLDVRGVSMSRGDLYSPPNQLDALLIARDRRAWIDPSPVETTGAYNGLSGFRALMLDGRNVAADDELHPRSAVGVSKDGRCLILMVIDGRQTGYSEGTSTAETAEWIHRLGAHDALNLDGGGSTALVIEGPDRQPRVLNSPSGKYERLVANHLGVFAKRLPDSR